MVAVIICIGNGLADSEMAYKAIGSFVKQITTNTFLYYIDLIVLYM